LTSSDLQQGEICISGSNVTKGYWNKPPEETFIKAAGRNYLRTGDIGFFYQDELFIMGRIKEMLIVRGKNYYPYDIENAVSANHPELEPHGVIAFETPHQEGFIIAAELKRKHLHQIQPEPLMNAISRTVVSSIGISPSDILILLPHAIPRTTSGKPKRLLCKERYTNNQMPGLITKRNKPATNTDTPSRPPLITATLERKDHESIKDYLTHVIHSKSDIAALPLSADTDVEFYEMGIDSLKMMEIINTINKDLHINLQASDIARNSSLHSLIHYIEQLLWLKYGKARGKEIVI
jgi:acyl carrier protein